jgi:hypothetical protein
VAVAEPMPVMDPAPDEVHCVVLWPRDGGRTARPDDETVWSTGNRSKAGKLFNGEVDAEGAEDELAAWATRSHTARDDSWEKRAFVDCFAFKTRPEGIAAWFSLTVAGTNSGNCPHC